DAAIPEDRGVEHGADSEGNQVRVAELVRQGVGGGIVRGNVPSFFEGSDVGGKVAGLKDRARRVSVLRELVELTAAQERAVLGKGPHSNSLDLDCMGRDLGDTPQDVSD